MRISLGSKLPLRALHPRIISLRPLVKTAATKSPPRIPSNPIRLMEYFGYFRAHSRELSAITPKQETQGECSVYNGGRTIPRQLRSSSPPSCVRARPRHAALTALCKSVKSGFCLAAVREGRVCVGVSRAKTPTDGWMTLSLRGVLGSRERGDLCNYAGR